MFKILMFTHNDQSIGHHLDIHKSLKNSLKKDIQLQLKCQCHRFQGNNVEDLLPTDQDRNMKDHIQMSFYMSKYHPTQQSFEDIYRYLLVQYNLLKTNYKNGLLDC